VICLVPETARHETRWQTPFQPTLHNMVCCNCFIDLLGVYSGRAVGGWELKPRSLHTGLAGVLTAGEPGTQDTCRSNRESDHSSAYSAQQLSKQRVHRRGDRDDQRPGSKAETTPRLEIDVLRNLDQGVLQKVEYSGTKTYTHHNGASAITVISVQFYGNLTSTDIPALTTLVTSWAFPMPVHRLENPPNTPFPSCGVQ
jgi:hypothetical protein